MAWIPKWQIDLRRGFYAPIPTQIVSNEEFLPLPQTPAQQRVEQYLIETADNIARTHGQMRRDFLRTTGGMALAFLALNRVFGPYFMVDPVEAREPAAFGHATPRGQFILDVQTHYVAAGRAAEGFLGLRRAARAYNSALAQDTGTMADLNLINYIKEIFLDSDTAVAVVSGIPADTWEKNILPPDQMAGTRRVVNALTSSQRLLSHGLITPNKGLHDIEDMHRQHEQLKVDAWKGYTGIPFGQPRRSWWLDDEHVAYPVWEASRKMGIRNICIHKGFPFGAEIEHAKPRDVIKAARDFPGLNFIIYHSAFRGLWDVAPALERGIRPDTRVEWVTELCELREQHPELSNVYAELGSVFAQTVIASPRLCAYILGRLIKAFGSDHVLWGTDAIWWGSPQWQIEALRRFRIPDDMLKHFGFAPLTDEVKAKILGLNGANIFGVDPQVARNPIPPDYVAQLKARYLEEGAQPSNTQYGLIRAK